MRIKDVERDSDGQLPSYAWPGGYPIYYLDKGNSVLCAKCATEALDRVCSTCEGARRTLEVFDCVFCFGLGELFDITGNVSLGPCPACLAAGARGVFPLCHWCNGTGKENNKGCSELPVALDVYYEGPVMQCEGCNVDIESAYGDPDEPEPEPAAPGTTPEPDAPAAEGVQ